PATVTAPSSASASPMIASPPARQSPPASTAQPTAAIAMPTHPRPPARSPIVAPSSAANTGLVATSATDAAVDVKYSDAIHTPRWMPNSTPDNTISAQSRPGSAMQRATTARPTTSSTAAASNTRSAATVAAGAGAAHRMN